ncbi:Na+/H+ antiporter subunit E [Xanthobacter oligotrophicus]|uniref:Na+/H+ antiporter subunit E n=1 Tax=Xanthobacter oligotrophicus TaxID=2607286 RepID=UPI0011F32DEF|nr:Na+/H+ antiporter subunit E [Xanthobacter oligotrophicus]MCG5236310.1 Na+/H+ antiporter subunit E [Xanthobacter oligotrophicus]
MGKLFSAHGAARWLSFFAGWVILGRIGAIDLAAGLIISALAAALSLHLLPPVRLNPRAMPAYAARFFAGSLRAGWDVAWRVAARPPQVNPGVLVVPCAVPQGLARDAFRALASLQPGTLPLPGRGPDLRVHCLDMDAPVVAALDADASAFLAVVDAPHHG